LRGLMHSNGRTTLRRFQVVATSGVAGKCAGDEVRRRCRTGEVVDDKSRHGRGRGGYHSTRTTTGRSLVAVRWLGVDAYELELNNGGGGFSGSHGTLVQARESIALRGGIDPMVHGEHAGVICVSWDGPGRRLRRRTTAAGASSKGETATALSGLNGQLATNGKLTRSTTEVAAGSMRACGGRNSSRIPPEPKTKAVE